MSEEIERKGEGRICEGRGFESQRNERRLRRKALRQMGKKLPIKCLTSSKVQLEQNSRGGFKMPMLFVCF